MKCHLCNGELTDIEDINRQLHQDCAQLIDHDRYLEDYTNLETGERTRSGNSFVELPMYKNEKDFFGSEVSLILYYIILLNLHSYTMVDK